MAAGPRGKGTSRWMSESGGGERPQRSPRVNCIFGRSANVPQSVYQYGGRLKDAQTLRGERSYPQCTRTECGPPHEALIEVNSYRGKHHGSARVLLASDFLAGDGLRRGSLEGSTRSR
jgi:hypothetical protein